jgi:hypothetical protein
MTFEEACVNALCRLPAAALLTSDALEKIIWAAFDLDFECVLDRRSAVYRLPAAANISSSAVLAMLEDRVNSWNYNWVEAICSLPSGQQLSSNEVEQLCQQALTHDAEHLVELLCQLPAAGQLDSSTIVQLLESAIQCCTKRFSDDATDCVEHLCRLPAAADISSSALVQLLQAELLEEHAIKTDPGLFILIMGPAITKCMLTSMSSCASCPEVSSSAIRRCSSCCTSRFG